MDDLRDRILKIAEYHCDEYAQRLSEIGGPGVGGTELAFSPKPTSPIDTHDEYIMFALESSIWRLWGEASWCYVYGQFSASIILSAVILEITLKYELLKKGENSSTDTLDPLIRKAGKNSLINKYLIEKAKLINSRRNDIVHANIQVNRPESLIHHTGDEHEIEPIKDVSRNITKNGWMTGDGETISISFTGKKPTMSRIYEFKKAAKNNLDDVLIILKHFYPNDKY